LILLDFSFEKCHYDYFFDQSMERIFYCKTALKSFYPYAVLAIKFVQSSCSWGFLGLSFGEFSVDFESHHSANMIY